MDIYELLTLASEIHSLEPDSLQRQVDWFDDRCCELVLRSGRGLQVFDANYAAVSEKQTIHKLTNFHLVSSHFTVSATAWQVEEIATLHVAATGPFYLDEMSRCIKNELVGIWSNTPFEERTQLTGWRLTLPGEVLKSAFEEAPNSIAHAWESYIQGLLERDLEPSSATVLNCEVVRSSKIALQSMGPPLPAPSDDPKLASTTTSVRAGILPKWDKESGFLWLGDSLCRSVAGHGKNVRKILDAFQNEGWPQSIQNPLGRRRNSRQIKDSCAQLNKGLSQIRFCPDGSGKGVRWCQVELG